MTMQRGSMIFAAEGYVDNKTEGSQVNPKSNFGHGRGYYYKKQLNSTTGKYESVRCKWIHAPPGTFFGTTHNRTASPIRAMGTKTWDTVQYGAITGSFNWTFTLDYQYLHILTFLFEGFTEKDIENVPATAEEATYVFEKKDNKWVKPFTVMRTILNEMAGGPEKSDEIVQLMGCVAKNLTLSRSAGSSTISVTITGMYADERMLKGSIEETDYDYDYDGNLTEYMCMFVSDEKKASIKNMDYIANTDTITIGIENNVDKNLNTCTPIAGSYYEGLSSYKFTTSCYSNNPEYYKQRLYGGGITVGKGEGMFRPLVKGLKPLKQITLLTYSGTAIDAATMEEAVTSEEIEEAFDKSDYTLQITINDMVLKSLTWPKGEGQKITDNISSEECKYMSMTFTCRKGKNGFSAMGSYDLFEDPKNIDLIKHTCETPVAKSKCGKDW